MFILDNKIIQYLAVYNHAEDAAKYIAASIVSDAKYPATDTQDGTHRILACSFANLSNAAFEQMTNTQSIKGTIRNVRNANYCVLAIQVYIPK